MLLGLMVKNFDNFSKRALVDRFDDFISIGNVVTDFVLVELAT